MSLVPFEIQILQECAGERNASPWGAAVGQALESLRGSGYLERRTGNLTAKGKEFLKEHGSKA